jgi:hypothetical protein
MFSDISMGWISEQYRDRLLEILNSVVDAGADSQALCMGGIYDEYDTVNSRVGSGVGMVYNCRT